MPLDLIAIAVRDEKGDIHAASLAVCSCGCKTFHVFQVVGQTHFHLQCEFCNEVYCPEGSCEELAP